MGRKPQDVTDAELAVLQVLWDRGGATRREITDVLYPGGGPAHYTTVQKLLERLESKGFVRKRREGGVLSFSALVDREGLIGRRLREMAETLCGGSLTPLLMNLVRARSLTAQELGELQRLLEDLRKGDRGKAR